MARRNHQHQGKNRSSLLTDIRLLTCGEFDWEHITRLFSRRSAKLDAREGIAKMAHTPKG
jgi:hypothetical protein